ncbi:MOSC domain-containing protein [Bryobacter aggregatus]|uniref:MOSC domain-containing protein n=1 Tax=Bryobacter aggregatus TaxID=360054 RepID=UPI0004E15634|nr:MOSC domain-containing protein [Bryobacter aggregatus]
MDGNISQLNISRGGLPKRPLPQAQLTPLGLEGDDWAHPQVHGGPNQALLLIGQEVLDELNALGYTLFPGALGENLTTTGLDYQQLALGQRFRLGAQGLIELTKLRKPCRTLDLYNQPGLEKIQKLLTQKGRGGWYARVQKGGLLFPGDRISLVDQVV